MKNLANNQTTQNNILNFKQFCPAIITLLWWGLTFITDRKVFTQDPLNMCSFPIDTQAVTLMHILSKLLLLFTIYGLVRMLAFGLRNKKFLIYFIVYFILYFSLLLLNYPGYFMSDDTILFSYATRYYPIYWHNYMTSVYYMAAISLIPASTGPIVLNDLVLAFVSAYILYETDILYTKKIKYIVIISSLMPYILLSATMCFRPAMYSPFFLFFYAFLLFEKKKQATLTINKICMLGFLAAVLCFWRTEGILLICFCLFLLPAVYGLPKKIRVTEPNTSKLNIVKHFIKNYKKALLFILVFIISFSLIKVPQSKGEERYYGSDYLIIATIRPLSVIIHREQSYPGAEEDLKNIDSVIALDYINYESLSCSSYNRYNADYNNGRFTETGASKEAQSKYIKSAINLILHNLDLYIGERIHLFCVTNGITGYDPAIVMDLKPVTTADFLAYQLDRDYGYELVEGNARWHYQSSQSIVKFLFEHGGEAYVPLLILTFLFTLYTLIRKKWFYFFAYTSLLAREALIFFTVPGSFVQYNYPMMFVPVFLTLMFIISDCEDGFFQKVRSPKSTAS